MRFFTLCLLIGSMAFATSKDLVNETFTTTFSDYGKLEKVLSCNPGHRGGYATYDTLTLQRHAVDLGFDVVGNQSFLASSTLGLDRETRRGGGHLRPYAEGCQLAIDQFKAALAGKDRFEVNVHRTLTQYPSIRSRADRELNGKVNSVKHFAAPLYYESYRVDIAGFRFELGQWVNGVADSL